MIMEFEMSSDIQKENKDENEQNAPQKKRAIPPRFPKRQLKKINEENSPGKIWKSNFKLGCYFICGFSFMWVFVLTKRLNMKSTLQPSSSY